MGKMNDGFSFTGSVGNLSVFKMKGVEKPVVRTKGGPSKEKIKKHPNFERTRMNNAEFGGRATASKWIMRSLWFQKPLADYNIAGPLNVLMKPIQALDTTSELGKRHILLTKNPHLLEGFSLNRGMAFDSIVRNPIAWTLTRNDQSASIGIPALIPQINLHVPGFWPMYSFVATIGIIPDLYYHHFGYQPLSPGYHPAPCEVAFTDWCPVMNGSPATQLDLRYPVAPPDEHFSVILAIGIRFGIMRDAATIEQAPNAGAAKVLAVG